METGEGSCQKKSDEKKDAVEQPARGQHFAHNRGDHTRNIVVT